MVSRQPNKKQFRHVIYSVEHRKDERWRWIVPRSSGESVYYEPLWIIVLKREEYSGESGRWLVEVWLVDNGEEHPAVESVVAAGWLASSGGTVAHYVQAD